MSVVQINQGKGGNSLLGALGGLATIGGALTGQPWLSALGTGLGAANSIMGGTANSQTYSTLGQIIKDIAKGGWIILQAVI